MSTSDDYRVQYHSHDVERGDLYIVVQKQTGEVVSPRPMPRHFADECVMLAGEHWTPERMDAAMKRLKPVPVNLVVQFWERKL